MTKRGSIFISYRREDSEGYAGWLYDRLSAHFKSEQVFMDVDNIEPGLDFVEVIENAVGSCDVLLAVIGRQWLTVADARGRRRLDNPEDFVRLEIAAALERAIRIIPVLVSGAAMPTSEDLPPALAKLARRNAIELTAQRWNHDIGRLIRVVEGVLAPPASKPAPSRRKSPRADAAPAAQPPPEARQTASSEAAPDPAQSILQIDWKRLHKVESSPLPRIEWSEVLRQREAIAQADALRFAEQLVSGIQSTSEHKVRAGRARGDIYGRLRAMIDRAREVYDQRFPFLAHDYFHDCLVRMLANGDVTKLGPDYPANLARRARVEKLAGGAPGEFEQ